MTPTRRSGAARGAAPKGAPVRFSWQRLLKQCRKAHTTAVAVCSQVRQQFGLDVRANYYAGGGRPSVETLWALAQVLDCQMEDLLESRHSGPGNHRGRAA